MKKRGLGRREYPGKISVREGGGRTTEIPTGKEDPGGGAEIRSQRGPRFNPPKSPDRGVDDKTGPRILLTAQHEAKTGRQGKEF